MKITQLCEKAIHEANLGLSPVAEKDLIRLIFPPLTEERRKEYIKLHMAGIG